MTERQAAHHRIALRSITAADRAFLLQVYASTRAEEMLVVDWNAAQKEAFLAMQFAAQHKYYLEQYPYAAFDIILLGGIPIGRLYVARQQTEIRIVDVALLPEHRGRGVGSMVLQAIQAEGSQAHLPVTIHVERFNPALRLYKRLGFQMIEDKGVYLLMKWVPEGDTDG